MSNYQIVCNFVYEKALLHTMRYSKDNKGHIQSLAMTLAYAEVLSMSKMLAVE